MEEAFFERKEVLAAFLNVEGAFDNVDSNILLLKLGSMGVSYSILKFVKFITYERFLFTNFTKSAPRLAFKGVPQGGVLSPLLYILYTADVAKDLHRSISISQFADNLAVYLKSAFLKRGKAILERAINIIKNNLLYIGLKLPPCKTVLMHFNNKKVAPGNVNIKIDYCSIRSSDNQSVSWV